MRSNLKTFLSRIKVVQAHLKEETVDAIFVDNPIDLFYLTGMHMSLGHLYISQKSARLFVDGRYKEAAEVQSATQVGNLEEREELAFLKGAKTLVFDSNALTYSGFIKLKKKVAKQKVKLLPKASPIGPFRMIKDAGEVERMRISAKFAYRAYKYIRSKVKTGVTELELATSLRLFCLKNGAEGMSFDPIVAFGKNTALPHHHSGKTKCKANDVILFDLGVMLDGYASDMTRVDFIGKTPPKLLQIFEVNKRAQQAALSECRPGVSLKRLDDAARKVMAKANLEKYFIHSLGHGIGLEVHEGPRIKFDGPDRNLKLREGMAITIEPGLYLPGIGGVRYEDTIVITHDGYENLYPGK